MAVRPDPVDELVLTEAAAWLVRLQDEGRTPAVEAGLREWLAEPAHAHAFDKVTATWEVIPGAWDRRAGPAPARINAPMLVAAAVMAVVIGGLALLLPAHDPSYETRVGQQQIVTLADGTHVTLNTASRLVVSYRRGERRVRLVRGEALFEVTKDARRPFSVEVGDARVRALGTTFMIRSDPGATAVTLMEGKVEVAKTRPLEHPRPLAVLEPGERFTLSGSGAGVLDRPNAEAVTAWRRGQVIFDDVTLVSAAAELNRYSENRIAVDPTVGAMRVSGAFRYNDLQEFGEVVAKLHGLTLRQEGVTFTLHR